MKIIKLVYNQESEYLTQIIKNLSGNNILEFYNIDYNSDRKKSRELMTRFGTKNVPLVVFCDENLEEYTAIWSESNPDWELEIKKKLNL